MWLAEPGAFGAVFEALFGVLGLPPLGSQNGRQPPAFLSDPHIPSKKDKKERQKEKAIQKRFHSFVCPSEFPTGHMVSSWVCLSNWRYCSEPGLDECPLLPFLRPHFFFPLNPEVQNLFTIWRRIAGMAMICAAWLWIYLCLATSLGPLF